MSKDKLIPACCGVCGDVVPHAFRKVDGSVTAEKGWGICTEGNIVYHYSEERNCYGIKHGYKGFP